jgi:hypothetical protein
MGHVSEVRLARTMVQELEYEWARVLAVGMEVLKEPRWVLLMGCVLGHR